MSRSYFGSLFKSFFVSSFAFFFLSEFFSVPAVAQDHRQKIESILSGIKDYKTSLGVYIAKRENEVIFKNQENQLFIPASVTKIVTAKSILENLGPGTKLVTSLRGQAHRIEKEELNGDLCFKGSGDPSFVSENLWVLVNNFTRNRIRSIRGDIVVDDTLFDSVLFDESRIKNRTDRAYDAPVSASSFNWNSLNVYIRPGPKKGDPAWVTLDPGSEYVVLDNQVKTTAEKTQVSVSKVTLSGQDKIIVRGSISTSSSEIVQFMPISHPSLWTGFNVKAFLKERGISVGGQVRRGVCDPQSQILSSSESKPVEQMIQDMNKFSNNFVAEMLVKVLAAHGKSLEGGLLEMKASEAKSSVETNSSIETKSSVEINASVETRASLSEGIALIKKYLKNQNFSEQEILFENPSGLTRDNKMTAFFLWRFLQESQSDLRWNGELLSSLPLAGIDGTLKKRFTDSSVRGRIRAKTGYLNGVVSLSGYYAESSYGKGFKQSHIVPFVFLYNGSESETKVRDTIDKTLSYLVTQK
jgi:serine-type D-Ala-D-Ala carboxypeptidase/endopeptidase (penicillin-binding protein 4)